MSDISKAYNLSVRDDTTFRVEGGGSEITLRNIMSNAIVVKAYDASDTAIETKTLENLQEMTITGATKTIVIRNASV